MERLKKNVYIEYLDLTNIEQHSFVYIKCIKVLNVKRLIG